MSYWHIIKNTFGSDRRVEQTCSRAWGSRIPTHLMFGLFLLSLSLLFQTMQWSLLCDEFTFLEGDLTITPPEAIRPVQAEPTAG